MTPTTYRDKAVELYDRLNASVKERDEMAAQIEEMRAALIETQELLLDGRPGAAEERLAVALEGALS